MSKASFPGSHSLLASALLVLVAGGTLGCTSESEARLFAQASWKVRCSADAEGGCVDAQPHDVAALDGEDGFDLSCSVNEFDGNRRITFSIKQGVEYSLTLRNIIVPPIGGAPIGNSCSIQMLEENYFEGACGGEPPNEVQPCQVSLIQFSEEADGPTLRGKLLCRSLPGRAVPDHKRDVASADDLDAAVDFRFVNCSGQ